MKKTTVLLCITFLVFYVSNTYAQPWLNLLPKEKSYEKLQLKDYQNAFYTYMESDNFENDFVVSKIARENGLEKFKRWEYYMEGVVDSLGFFPDKTGIQVVREHKKTNPEVYSKTPKSSNWSSLGPFQSTGGYAGIGRINCVAFHPDNNDIWWIGAASGGLWVTTNNGSSWECLTDDNGVLAVSDIVIPSDYSTSNTIYIATGDRCAGDNNSIGVLKSTDNGVTWFETGLTFSIGQGRRTNRLLLDPNDDQTLIAATSIGVFKTTDGGTTWDTQLANLNFIDMEYKPGDFNTLYGSRGAGIWKSIDGGENWEQVAIFSQQRTELAVSEDNPDIVYALVSNNSSGLYGVFKSTNSGDSFQQVAGSTPNMLGWNSNGSGSGGQGWYDLCIAASPTDADVVLIGGVNTWRSTNGGANWHIVNHWWGDGVQAVHADKHTLVYRNDGMLFEGNDGGIYVSPQNGTSGTWIDKTNGMRISQMYKLGCSATNPTEIITGLQDNGSKLFSGNDWHDVYGGDGMECIIDYSNENIQYATLYYGRIFMTMDHWDSVEEISPRDDGAWVTPYIIDPKDPQTLYAGYNNLYKTVNRGYDWTQISTVNASNKIRNIAICEADRDVIIMDDGSKIWRTDDGGNNWTKIITTSSITSLCIKNDDPNTMWYSRGGYNAMSVFKSIDGGTTWISISDGLPAIPAYSLVYNKLEGQKEQLYLGTEVGVYFKDGDEDWVAFNTGLPNVKIGEIELYYDLNNPQQCRLRAATYGRGLWESPIYIPTTPVAGTATGNTKLCTKEATQLFLIGFSGSIQWQESWNGTNWFDIPNATQSFYQSNQLYSSTYYRAKVTLGTTVYSNELFVEVTPTPTTPYISRIDKTLVSNAEIGNQWYNQDGPIPGAIEKVFTPTENGTYFTIVTINTCSSNPSNSILINDLSIGGNAIKDGYFTIYPNPTNDKLQIVNYDLRTIRIVLVDVNGREVLNIQPDNAHENTLNLSRFSSGIYQLRIETDKGVFTSKIVKH